MSVEWTPEQLNAIESRNGALLVSAAAGSGKTAVLVERLLRFVSDEGYDIDKFLMITYTNAAASELRAKIIEALSERVAENPENRHLARQMNIVHRANISTIHAYCMQLLRTHGHYLNITSDFKIIDEGEGEILRNQALETLLEERYEENSVRFQTLCAMLVSGRDDRELVESILKLHSKSRTHPNPKEWLSKCAKMYTEGSNVWENEIVAYIKELCGHLKARVDLVLGEIKRDPALEAAYASALASDKKNIESLINADGWDELFASAGAISIATLSSSRGCQDVALRKWAKDERDGVKGKLESLCKKFLVKDKKRIYDEIKALSPVAEEMCLLAGELDDRFTEMKVSRGLMDYSDLEHCAVKLLVEHYDEDEDKVIPTALAREISDDFCEIMVDEYQDSNCIQDIVFRAISKNERNLTMVGDLKQSIYRFRLADPTIFLNKYKSFKPFSKAEDGEARVVKLSRNFRSRKEVLDTCNKFFTATMTERLGELNYTKEEYLNARDKIPETELDCESELVIVDLDEKNSTAELPSVREAEAKYIAARIRELKEQGVPYEDVVILLRSQANRASIYARELREYGIPCVSEKKDGILNTVEVSVILSFLQIIDNPLWDVPLVSVLRSPLFAFTADDLAYVRRQKRGAMYHALLETAKGDKEISARAKEFVELLAELRDLAGEIGSDELIWSILDKTGARGLFGAMTEGNVRISNLNEFYNYARRFESQEFRGLHAFLKHITYLMNNAGDIAGDNTENSSGAVKIMSIHKSKGLEYPIVFVADGSKKFNEKDLQQQVLVHPKYGIGLNFRDNKLRYECPSIARNCITLELKNEMKSEELRILYVAMTRAKNKLIVMCTQKDAERRLQQVENMASCGEISPIDLLNSSSMDMWFLLPQMAQPGIFSMKTVKYEDIPDPVISETDDDTDEGALDWQIKELEARLNYEYPYASAVNTEGKITATGIAHESVSVHRHFPRPRFEQKTGLTASERGVAIHLVMQFIDFEKCDSLQGVKQEIARLYNEEYLTKEQYEVIPASKIYAFFESELGKLALNGKCRREFNFSRLVPVNDEDSALLQGVVDLMIEDEDGIIVVDFKSDAAINDINVGQYRRQLQVYEESLEAILEKKVKASYLYFLQHDEIIKL